MIAPYAPRPSSSSSSPPSGADASGEDLPPPPPAGFGALGEDLPPPPAGGFGAPGGGFVPPKANGPAAHSLAAASMIFGIAAIPSCYGFLSGLPLALAALVFGILALQKIRNDPQVWRGRKMALAGIVCGAGAIAVSAIFVPWAPDALPFFFFGQFFPA